MALQFIDTHAHLDDAAFDADRAGVISRAKEAGLSSIITVGCWKTRNRVSAQCQSLSKIMTFSLWRLASIPTTQAKPPVLPRRSDLIRKIAEENKKLVAIGETGLDYHYKHSPPKVQRELFISQIALARVLNLPIIVHTREAEDETIEILKGEGAGEVGGVLHCFSGVPLWLKAA